MVSGFKKPGAETPLTESFVFSSGKFFCPQYYSKRYWLYEEIKVLVRVLVNQIFNPLKNFDWDFIVQAHCVVNRVHLAQLLRNVFLYPEIFQCYSVVFLFLFVNEFDDHL